MQECKYTSIMSRNICDPKLTWLKLFQTERIRRLVHLSSFCELVVYCNRLNTLYIHSHVQCLWKCCRYLFWLRPVSFTKCLFWLRNWWWMIHVHQKYLVFVLGSGLNFQPKFLYGATGYPKAPHDSDNYTSLKFSRTQQDPNFWSNIFYLLLQFVLKNSSSPFRW